MRQEPQRISTARGLRREMTTAEARLWAILRGRKLGGWKFRRQHPVGPYYADFCCVALKVVVEVDGDSHLGQERHDRNRDEYMQRQGYVVVRVENRDVMFDENRVVEVLAKVLRERADATLLNTPSPSPLTPLPQGSGEQES